MPDIKVTDLLPITGVTLNDVLHVVDVDDTTQDPAGSSYKATVSDIFDSITGYCISDLYVTNIHGCSPINIQPTSSDDVYMVMGGGNVGVGLTSPTEKLHVSGDTSIENSIDGDTTLLVKNTNNGGTLARGVIATSAIADVGGRTLFGLFLVSGYNTAIPGFSDGGSGYLQDALTITVAGDDPRGDINIGTRNAGKFLRFFAEDSVVPIGDFSPLTLRGSLSSNGYWGFGTNMTGQTSTVHINGANGYSQFRIQQPYTPTPDSSDPNGSVGQIAWDEDYIYVKTSVGWKRSGLTSF